MSSPPRTAAIVQARMSSRRFPGKMLALLADKPLIEVVCDRLARARLVDVVVVATSDDPSDDPLAATARAAGYQVFRGSLQDVLARFVGAARSVDATAVVRITGDCPCVEASLVDVLIERLRTTGADYAANVNPPTWPNGLDCEVMTMAALEKTDREATTPHDREHVTTYIRARPGIFSQDNLANPRGDQSHLRWSIDHPEDLALVQGLWTATGLDQPALDDLLAALEANPELQAASCPSRRRNEGSVASLRADLEGAGPLPRSEQSEVWWHRAKGSLVLGTQALARGPGQSVSDVAPKFLARGKGCRVWDVDGNEYIDASLGLAAVPLGHAHPEVAAAVQEILLQGTGSSWMHPLEVQLAERLCDIVPGAEKVCFCTPGSDAIIACMRAARAKTGRQQIARHGHRGWHRGWHRGSHRGWHHGSSDDTYGARAVPAEAMAKTTPFPYNDLEALEKVLLTQPCAAIIIEPVHLTPPTPGYLQGVRDLASRHGAVLIFDELLSGFRYARGGAQEYFAVMPDLSILGQGIANGQPLSVVAGRQEFIAPLEDIFSGTLADTFGGVEVSALSAAMTTLEVMEREDYWSHVWRQGQKLQDGYRALSEDFGLTEITDCQGMPPWTQVTFKDIPRWQGLQIQSLFQQEMLRRGILFLGSQPISLAHDDGVITKTLDAYRESMRVLRSALDLDAVDALLQGELDRAGG